jgi:hypothetical protein
MDWLIDWLIEWMDVWMGDEQVDGTKVQFSLHIFPRNSQIRNIVIIRCTVPDFLHIGQQMLIGVEIQGFHPPDFANLTVDRYIL